MNYSRILENTIHRISKIGDQMQKLHEEQEKLFQFINATIELLPDDEREEFQGLIQQALARRMKQSVSLTEAIREVLQSNKSAWLTVAKVRDHLVSNGFDFSDYKSNPLSSVSTTLKRLSNKERRCESKALAGITVYRWRPKSGGREPSPEDVANMPEINREKK